MKGYSRSQLGQAGEEMAEAYLQEQGYEILARNFRTRHGEIDRIVRKGGTIVFVEVKTRRSLTHGTPTEAITLQKRQKIRQTALAYLQEHGGSGEILRFDVISILLQNADPPKIEHLQSAF
ncbi:YraN family protein [Brevibacillus fluminis]|uniref:YraN family protein n=1 Tax=Brevibacillus fluminis TaxID=511487 RepID=UPI003F890BB4